MSFFNEITPTTRYTELLGIEGLTADMIKLWRPDAKNIEGILKQNKDHIRAMSASNENT